MRKESLQRGGAAFADGRLKSANVRRGILTAFMIYPSVLVAAAMRHGPGVSPDSVGYVSVARSFASSGKLFPYWADAPLTIWPPGFPVLLGASIRLGLDAESIAGGVNLLCLALTVYLSYVLGTRALRSPLLGLVVAGVVSLSVATVRVFSMLWTEPLFTVLVLLALIWCLPSAESVKAGEGEGASFRVILTRVVAAGALVSIATTIRFTGLNFIPVVAVAAGLLARTHGRLRTAQAALVGACTAAAGLAFVVVRNLLLGADALGHRNPQGVSLPQAIVDGLWGVGAFFSDEPSTNPAIVIGSVVMAFLLAGGIDGLRRRDENLLIVATAVVIWWGSLGYSTIITDIDSINPRLLYPIFPAMITLVIAGFRYLSVAVGAGDRSTVLQVGGAVLGLSVVALSVSLGPPLAYSWFTKGIGYNNLEVRASPLARSLTSLPRSARIASNRAALTYWVTGRRLIEPVDRHPLEGEAADLSAGTYVALFIREDGTDPLDSPRLSGIDMRIVSSFRDGSLFQVISPDTTASN